jgi:hypothetical protein
MVTSLSNLRSTNGGGQRKVFVTANNDATATNSVIDFLVAGVNHSVTAILDANDTRELSVSHNQAGSVFVVATASGSQAITSKFLDLNADHSF